MPEPLAKGLESHGLIIQRVLQSSLIMNKQQKVNRIARHLGSKLCQIGIKILRNAFHIDPKVISGLELSRQVKAKIALNNLTLADEKYHLESWDIWKQIIETDWTDQKKYLKDYYDCDNFSYSFAARMSEIYGINAGIVHGWIYNKDTNKQIGGHLWNVILTKEGDLYFYEPMNDNYVEAKTNVIMGKWRYQCASARFI